MKITKNYINTTKNQILREVLTAMENNIDLRINTIAKWEEEVTEKPTTEFGFECIELGLIYDLAKSVIVYTNNTDKVISFEAGTSVKGNFEMTGSIERNNEIYKFRTEAIIASGAVQRAHYRYITKTTLPKAGNIELANEIKKVISKNKKITNIQSHLNTLINYKSEAKAKLDEMNGRTNQDWINAINESQFPMFIANNWESMDDDHKTYMKWNNESDYIKFVDEKNIEKIEREKVKIDWAIQRIISLTKSIAKEEIKLAKSKLI